jgi:hypothetical protein
MALLVSSALASSEDIELDPEEGEISDRIDIYGDNFEVGIAALLIFLIGYMLVLRTRKP